MTDQEILEVAEKYRLAIEAAHNDNQFAQDIKFKNFPTDCCGDTCDLLAEYFKRHGVDTIQVFASKGFATHAWLVVKDSRIKEPTRRSFSWPEELRDVIAKYGVENPHQEIDTTRYNPSDIKDGLIIDITADQFLDYKIPVYVGAMDDFHASFDFVRENAYIGLGVERIKTLYYTIERYL